MEVFGGVAQLFRGFQIIVYRFVKRGFQLGHRFSVKPDNVANSCDVAHKAGVLVAVFNTGLIIVV